MNRQRMEALANELENPTRGVGFSMCDIVKQVCPPPAPAPGWPQWNYSVSRDDVASNECGTICCIGGLACVLFGTESDRHISAPWAQQLLDLTPDEADSLFLDEHSYVTQGNVSFGQVTRAQAADAVRRLLAEDVAGGGS